MLGHQKTSRSIRNIKHLSKFKGMLKTVHLWRSISQAREACFWFWWPCFKVVGPAFPRSTEQLWRSRDNCTETACSSCLGGLLSASPHQTNQSFSQRQRAVALVWLVLMTKGEEQRRAPCTLHSVCWHAGPCFSDDLNALLNCFVCGFFLFAKPAELAGRPS